MKNFSAENFLDNPPKFSGVARTNKTKKNLGRLIREHASNVRSTPIWHPLPKTPTGLAPREMDSDEDKQRVKSVMETMANFISKDGILNPGVTVGSVREKLYDIFEEEASAVHSRYVRSAERDIEFVIGNLIKAIKNKESRAASRDRMQGVAYMYLLQGMIVGFLKNLRWFARDRVESNQPLSEKKKDCFSSHKLKFKAKSKCIQNQKKLSKKRADAYTASVLRKMGEIK